MKTYGNEKFLTYAEMQRLLPSTAEHIAAELKKYIYFDGLANDTSNPLGLYIEGFIIPLLQKNENNFDVVTDIELSVFCNKKELEGNRYTLKNQIVDEPYLTSYTADEYEDSSAFLEGTPLEYFYRLEEIRSICEQHQIPFITSESKKEAPEKFSYDVDFVTKKSFFSIRELAGITVNESLFDQDESEDLGLFNYNEYKQSLILISEAIGRSNADGFRLQPIELWVNRNDFDEGEYSEKLLNTLNLALDVELNIHKTLLSKDELIRWCKYQNIDIGILNNEKHYLESLDTLKIERDQLNQELVSLQEKYKLQEEKLLQSMPPLPQPALNIEKMGEKQERTYRSIIGSLVLCLSKSNNDFTKKNEPFIGYEKETGSSGIVGYIKSNNLSVLSSSTLSQYLKDGLKSLK